MLALTIPRHIYMAVHRLAHPSRMLIGLQGEVQHFTGLIALLIYQLVADGQKAGEAGLDNVIEVDSVVAIGGLVAEGAADGEETLKSSKRRAGIVGVEQLQSKVHEARPSGREIVL